MTTIIRVLVLALTVVFSTVNAQDFQGIATYKTQRKMDIKMDSTSTGVSKEMHAQMMEMMKKQFQKTFKLRFNKEESIYKEEESLDKPQTGIGGSVKIVTVGQGGGSDVLYKNTKENRYADQTDTYGKIFLVKDEIKNIDWKLESDTKYIGEYQCYKATYTEQVKVIKSVSFVGDSKKDNKKAEEEKEPEMEDRIITAWYTPQIPVNNGPAKYQGLPGLILEVHDGDLTVICSRIVINPEDKIDINEPTKGKEVNEKAYNKIMKKKAGEMKERFRSRKNGRDVEGISISIGG